MENKLCLLLFPVRYILMHYKDGDILVHFLVHLLLHLLLHFHVVVLLHVHVPVVGDVQVHVYIVILVEILKFSVKKIVCLLEKYLSSSSTTLLT